MVEEYELLRLVSFLREKKNRSIILYLKGEIQAIKQLAQDFHNWLKKYGLHKKILHTYLEDEESILGAVRLHIVTKDYSAVLSNSMEGLSDVGYQSFLLDVLKIGKEIIDIRDYDFSDVYDEDVIFEYEEFAFGEYVDDLVSNDKSPDVDNVIFHPFQSNAIDIYYGIEGDEEEYYRDDDYYADLDYRKGGVTYE